MPCASDFDAAAEILWQAATEVAVWATGTRSRFGPDTVAGGALTVVCHQAVDVAENTATSTAEALRDRAKLCRQRARAVRAYEAALGQHAIALRDWRAIIDDLPPGLAAPSSPRPPSKPSFAP